MRPANQQQAVKHMDHLLKRRLIGNRSTKVKEHRARAKQIAIVIWQRFQMGPYQYQLKHLRWYLEVYAQNLTPNTRYRHWLTIKQIASSLNKQIEWVMLIESSRCGLSRMKVSTGTGVV